MSTWNTRPPEATIPELTLRVAALTREVTKALREHGGDSREARNAEYLLRAEVRRLEHAKHKAAKFERLEGMTPAQIVDEAMGR